MSEAPSPQGRASAPIPAATDELGVVRSAVVRDLGLIRDFADPSLEWRRLLSEMVGTFLLVVAGAGGGVVNAVTKGQISRTAAVVAPALTVMAVILFMGAVSGAHLNPAVSVAFALRQDFPWRRVPAYVGAQLVGATVACLLLWAMLGKAGMLGATEPGPGFSALQATAMEALLTFGLVSTILGTASGAQNVGPLSALAVAGYIALAGLWSSPVSGASMNPARSFGPDLVLLDFSNYQVYVIGPLVGAVVAVGLAWLLRGPGGDVAARRAAQGELSEPVSPDQAAGT
jgi:aquaporin Z